MAKEVEVIFEVEQELYDGVQKICKHAVFAKMV